MRTRCPKCDTRYNIAPEDLLEADGVARCYRCGTVFDIVAEDASTQVVHHAAQGDNAAALDKQSELPTPTPGSGSRSELAAPSVDAHELWGPRAHADAQTGQSELPAPTVDPDSLSALLQVTVTADDQEERPAPAGDLDDESIQSDPPGPADEPPPPPEPRALPFAVPDDLEPLQPSPDIALDVADTLYEEKSRRGFYYGLVAVLLVAGLGLQLTWQHRKDLIAQYPMLAPLCEYTQCLPSVVRAPQRFRVVQRDIRPTANTTDSLTLHAKIRNEAETAQPYPDIQLSLLDDTGGVLVRRRLAPSDYLFPPPPKEKVVSPGEVVTITLDFKDPGAQASGFIIGFL